MNLSFKRFLEIDSSVTDFKKGNYTMTGIVYLPIGEIIPIIKKGYGCVGLADIKSLNINENVTSIRYKFTNISDNKTAKAYYDLYLLNTNKNSPSNDFYENTDQLIPGAIGLKSAASWNEKPKKSKNYFIDEEDIW